MDLRRAAGFGRQRLDPSGNRVSDVSPPGDVSGPLRLRLAVDRASAAAPLGRLTVRCRPWLDVEVEGSRT